MYVECIGGASGQRHRRVDVDLYSKSMTAYLYDVVVFFGGIGGFGRAYIHVNIYVCMHARMYVCISMELSKSVRHSCQTQTVKSSQMSQLFLRFLPQI